MKKIPAYALTFIIAILGSLFCATPAKSADSSLDIFTGLWCNKDFETRGNTRIRIHLDGEKLIVHMWGRCHPSECDWGDAVATLAPDDRRSILVTWSQAAAVSAQKLTIQEDGSLKLTGTRTYKDSGKPALKESGTFAKGLEHDWSDKAEKSKKKKKKK